MPITLDNVPVTSGALQEIIFEYNQNGLYANLLIYNAQGVTENPPVTPVCLDGNLYITLIKIARKELRYIYIEGVTDTAAGNHHHPRQEPVEFTMDLQSPDLCKAFFEKMEAELVTVTRGGGYKLRKKHKKRTRKYKKRKSKKKRTRRGRR
jgi:hypothetical protein